MNTLLPKPNKNLSAANVLNDEEIDPNSRQYFNNDVNLLYKNQNTIF